jgi:hypothetical protein
MPAAYSVSLRARLGQYFAGAKRKPGAGYFLSFSSGSLIESAQIW